MHIIIDLKEIKWLSNMVGFSCVYLWIVAKMISDSCIFMSEFTKLKDVFP